MVISAGRLNHMKSRLGLNQLMTTLPPPPPARALVCAPTSAAMVAMYEPVICAALDRLPSSTSPSDAGRPPATSRSNSSSITSAAMTCCVSMARRRSSLDRRTTISSKLGLASSRETSSALAEPLDRDSRPISTLRTSSVAAKEKNSNWISGGSTSDRRTLGSRSNAQTSLTITAFSRGPIRLIYRGSAGSTDSTGPATARRTRP